MQNLTSSDLSRLFGAALETMETHQQAVNDLDGYNGNHGDNMVQNLRTITAALSAHEDAEPSEALKYASRELEAQGKGSTSSYYAKGLNQAAERLEGRSELSRGDVMTLVQSLLGAVPSEGYSQQADAGGSVFDQVIGLAADQQAQGSASAPESLLQTFLQAQSPQGQSSTPGSSFGEILGSGPTAQDSQQGMGDLLGALLGGQQPQGSGATAQESQQGMGDLLGALLGGQQPQSSGAMAQDSQQGMGGLLSALLGGQPPQGSGDAPGSPLSALLGSEEAQGGGNVLGGVLGALLGGQQPPSGQPSQDRPTNLIRTLLPAVMAFLQAKQSGAEMPEAAVQALMALLANRQMNPLQAGTPRSAAGGLVAQSILQALSG